ncbi:hypothetical protein OAJ82_00785 [Alphaproteobacteria bacterium]|nr:hypothetical protein [Alphaproteobacteria bacterium]
MNKKINESFNFLIKEYQRLKLKNKHKTISDEEKQTLRKIASFIGKKDE